MTALTQAGIVVSLGHTDTTYATAHAYAEAGATMVTHLFNAMSQIGNREPGMVGAALDDGRLSAGLIADGIHVHPANIANAVRAKRGPGRIVLVTDAMATIGTDMTSFTLNGRTIHRKDGRLTLDDGTLAGADLDMISAVRFMHRDDRRRSRRGAAHGISLSGRSHRPGRAARKLREGSRGQYRVAVGQARHARRVDRWRAGLFRDLTDKRAAFLGTETKDPAGEPAGSFDIQRRLLALVVLLG